MTQRVTEFYETSSPQRRLYNMLSNTSESFCCILFQLNKEDRCTMERGKVIRIDVVFIFTVVLSEAWRSVGTETKQEVHL